MPFFLFATASMKPCQSGAGRYALPHNFLVRFAKTSHVTIVVAGSGTMDSSRQLRSSVESYEAKTRNYITLKLFKVA